MAFSLFRIFCVCMVFKLVAAPSVASQRTNVNVNVNRPASFGSSGFWMGINVKDYGAIGDGLADDGPAFQRAIVAATTTGETLLVPAGHYRVNQTLSVPPLMSAGHNRSAALPLRLVGAGSHLSIISAGKAMLAVLNFTALSGPLGPAIPIPYENAFVSDIEIDASQLANFSLFAPGIARSRFTRVSVSGALTAGMSLGYGWCLYIEEGRFSGNGIGLHTYNAGNNVDVVMSIFEANNGPAIYASGGAQIKISGNVIEGNGGPGIVVVACSGVSILSNYFEANNGYDHHTGVMYLKPALDNTTAPVIKVNADIVLNGAPSFHDGNSDFKHWKPLDWYYGKAYLPKSVIIQGNTHAPNVNGTAVLAIACDGLTLTGNAMTEHPLAGTVCKSTSIAMLEMGSDAELFSVTNVVLQGNTGFSACIDANDTLLNDGLTRLTPTTKRFNGDVGLHSWQNEDSPRLTRNRNLMMYLAAPNGAMRSVSPWKTDGDCVLVSTAIGYFDGYVTTSINKASNADVNVTGANVNVTGNTSSIGWSCVVTVLALNIVDMPELQGQTVYVHVQANVLLPHTGLSVVIDAGDGQWSESNDATATTSPLGWQTLRYQITLANDAPATVRVGVRVACRNAQEANSTPANIGSVVVARVGAEWSRLLR